MTGEKLVKDFKLTSNTWPQWCLKDESLFWLLIFSASTDGLHYDIATHRANFEQLSYPTSIWGLGILNHRMLLRRAGVVIHFFNFANIDFEQLYFPTYRRGLEVINHRMFYVGRELLYVFQFCERRF